eukprot:100580-Amphidinium_carterae.3
MPNATKRGIESASKAILSSVGTPLKVPGSHGRKDFQADLFVELLGTPSLKRDQVVRPSTEFPVSALLHPLERLGVSAKHSQAPTGSPVGFPGRSKGRIVAQLISCVLSTGKVITKHKGFLNSYHIMLQGQDGVDTTPPPWVSTADGGPRCLGFSNSILGRYPTLLPVDRARQCLESLQSVNQIEEVAVVCHFTSSCTSTRNLCVAGPPCPDG